MSCPQPDTAQEINPWTHPIQVHHIWGGFPLQEPAPRNTSDGKGPLQKSLHFKKKKKKDKNSRGYFSCFFFSTGNIYF